MKTNHRHFKLLLIVLLMGVSFPRESFAYIDPGTGTYILQILIAGLITASVAVRTFWKQIKLFVGGLFGKNKERPKDSEPEETK